MAQIKLSLTFMYEIDPSKASGLHYKHFFLWSVGCARPFS